ARALADGAPAPAVPACVPGDYSEALAVGGGVAGGRPVRAATLDRAASYTPSTRCATASSDSVRAITSRPFERWPPASAAAAASTNASTARGTTHDGDTARSRSAQAPTGPGTTGSPTAIRPLTPL